MLEATWLETAFHIMIFAQKYKKYNIINKGLIKSNAHILVKENIWWQNSQDLYQVNKFYSISLNVIICFYQPVFSIK